MNHDGSMSADAYLQKAAELNKRQEELQRERRILEAHKQRAAAEEIINAELLSRQIQQAADTPASDTVVIDFGRAKQPDVSWTPFSDVDIVVLGVHNLPTRVEPGHPLFLGHRSATEPMRQQMLSGRYPSVEDHLARNSISYEPFIDEMGQFVARQLTFEEEHAIKTRSNRNPVR